MSIEEQVVVVSVVTDKSFDSSLVIEFVFEGVLMFLEMLTLISVAAVVGDDGIVVAAIVRLLLLDFIVPRCIVP